MKINRNVPSSPSNTIAMLAKIFLVFSVVVLCCTSKYEVQPVSLNATLNSTVTFTCGATGVIVIYFYIGNTPAAENINANRGFHELSQDTINGTITRSLMVFAYKTNNNSNISCSVFPGNVRSETATLRIQGKQNDYSSVIVYINQIKVY